MSLRSLKTVIRCADFERSRAFYTGVLGLAVAEEWDEPQGRGCIFTLGGGYLEVYGMTSADPRYRAAFGEPVASDKVDLQVEVDSVDEWAARLLGAWPYSGPEQLPWGQRRIQLRDPDGLLIALWEQGNLTAG